MSRLHYDMNRIDVHPGNVSERVNACCGTKIGGIPEQTFKAPVACSFLSTTGLPVASKETIGTRQHTHYAYRLSSIYPNACPTPLSHCTPLPYSRERERINVN